MKPADIVYTLLKRFTSKNKYHLVSFYEFVKFFLHYLERDDSGRFDLFTTNTEDVITAQLILLEEKGICSLNYQGSKIETINFDSYFMGTLMESYKKVELSSEEHFPSEESCGFQLPNEIVESIDIKNDFIGLMQRKDFSETKYIRLKFPEDVKDILITGTLLNDRLLMLCFQRIQLYLNSKNNSNYLFRKLTPVLKQSEQSIQDYLTKAKSSPSQMVEQIKNPGEVSFPFWSQVSNFIIKELKDKNDKLAPDHTYCQCAYVIGYMNIFYRDKMHRDKDRVTALKSLGDRIRKPPYAYSISDIFGFKDGSTVLLNNKYSKDDLINYLESKTAPKEDELLPEIIRLRTYSKKEYYLHREIIVALCYKKVNDAHDHYRTLMLDDWEEQLKSFKSNDRMDDDEAFRKELERLIKQEDPLLYSLMNYDLLFLSVKQNPNANLAGEVKSYLNTKAAALFPIDEILNLRRKDLLTEAKQVLPFWRNIPVISSIMIFFLKNKGAKKSSTPKIKKAKSGRGDLDASGTSKVYGGTDEGINSNVKTTQQMQVAYKKRIYELKETFVGKGDIDMSLSELAERWNPLYDAKAKSNLVEDVNSLTRDYLRTLKRGLMLSPPDETRIRNMAQLLGENKGLDKIKKRDLLIRYLEMYIIKCLQNVK